MNPAANVSEPLLGVSSSVAPPRAATSPPSKRLTFAANLSVHTTWPPAVYDRRGEAATCSRLTPALAQRIKDELNNYKLQEMEVHQHSRIYTRESYSNALLCAFSQLTHPVWPGCRLLLLDIKHSSFSSPPLITSVGNPICRSVRDRATLIPCAIKDTAEPVENPISILFCLNTPSTLLPSTLCFLFMLQGFLSLHGRTAENGMQSSHS